MIPALAERRSDVIDPMDELHLSEPGLMPAPDEDTMTVFRRLLVNTLAPA